MSSPRERHRLEGELGALGQRVGEADGAGEPRVDRRARGSAAPVPSPRSTVMTVLTGGLADDLGERRGRAAEDDDGLDAGVVRAGARARAACRAG